MKIEKKCAIKSPMSNAVKKAAATALGITAVIGLSACEETLSANESSQPPETTPTCGVEICGHEQSSSSYTDISSSEEPLSSSSLQALSSAAKKISSSSFEPPLTAGIPLIYSSSSPERSSSSSVAPVSSSEEEPIPLSGDIAPFEDSSSSSEEKSSNSEEPQSSSSQIEVQIKPITPDTVKQEPYTIHCDESDTTNYNIRLCKDPKGVTILSMVTTFEQDDIQA